MAAVPSTTMTSRFAAMDSDLPAKSWRIVCQRERHRERERESELSFVSLKLSYLLGSTITVFYGFGRKWHFAVILISA